MKINKRYIACFAFVLHLLSFSQKVENIHFEQVGKQINIYYDLQGDQKYKVQVFCSTNNGKTWGKPLEMVTGAVGENQKPKKAKVIVWDVLGERDKLLGEISFKIEALYSKKGVFTDTRDGQTYKWVKIGEQVWMAENLNYNSGTGSSCYENINSNCAKYGRLYKWEEGEKSCPLGWHMATDNEWKKLELYLGMSQQEVNKSSDHHRGSDQGKKLKAVSGWEDNRNGTDEVGFSALPGGKWNMGGHYRSLGYLAFWWSVSDKNSYYQARRYIAGSGAIIGESIYRDKYGKDTDKYSIRCVKD